jgi:ribokinase
VNGAVAVIGAINVDLVVSGASLPKAGETVVGGTFSQHPGGKGGNQAVAAARVSRTPDRVVMIGAVGDDALGRQALAGLVAEGIRTRVAVSRHPTGVALIVVDPAAQNQISVAPGANAALLAEDVLSALEETEPSVVLASLEVPIDVVGAAAHWARSRTAVVFVLNPAPAEPSAAGLLPLVDYLTPNEGELAALGPIPAGPRVIQTRGQSGAIIDGLSEIPTPSVQAVDTTGAGDCFNGVFAAALAEGRDVAEAARRAVFAAAISVTKTGAREGMPTLAELEDFLGR